MKSRRLFGKRKHIAVTVAPAVKVAPLFDWDWLAQHLLTAAWADEYERVTAPARAEYERVTALTLAEYERVTAPARAEYKRVTAPARAKYERVTALAFAKAYLSMKGKP